MLGRTLRHYVKVAKSVSCPISIPKIYGLFLTADSSDLRYILIFLVFLLNTMSQITNCVVLYHARTISSRIERLTYFVEAGVALALYGWMLRFSNRIVRIIPVRLSMLESLLLLAPAACMLFANVRFSVRQVRTAKETVYAVMNCLGRSFGCLLPVFMATFFAFRLMNHWARQVNNYSACLRQKRCQCELNCVDTTIRGSIQKHISAER